MFTVTITAEQRELLLHLLKAHAATADLLYREIFHPTRLERRARRVIADCSALCDLLSAAPAGGTPAAAYPLVAAAGAAGGSDD